MKKIIVSILSALGLRGLIIKSIAWFQNTRRDFGLWYHTRRFKPDELITYKSTPQGEMKLHLFRPQGAAPADGFPAVVFFHGGGWEGGSVRHFYAQCTHFASRGMVAISVDYRMRDVHGTSPYDATADCFSAVRWVRSHAEQLSVNPDKMVVGGGSVGGHMTAAVNFLPDLADPQEDSSISTTTSAMILFNAVLDTTERGWGAEKLGDDQLRFSPLHNVRPDLPPSIVLHGTADRVTPYVNAVEFTEAMKQQGNDCELFTYPDVDHGFYRYSLNRQLFNETLQVCDDFLVRLGILPAP